MYNMFVGNDITERYKMEEFVTEIQSNINVELEPIKKKTNRFRELLSKIIISTPEITSIGSCDEEGDISFEVTMKSIGVTYTTLLNYKNEMACDFTANFIGELLVRENIDKFAKVMLDLKDNYFSRVNKYNHTKFGMKIYKDKFILRFHVSLIQKLMLEDVRKTMI
jgi:hypothetical protein